MKPIITLRFASLFHAAEFEAGSAAQFVDAAAWAIREFPSCPRGVELHVKSARGQWDAVTDGLIMRARIRPPDIFRRGRRVWRRVKQTAADAAIFDAQLGGVIAAVNRKTSV